MTQKKLIDNAIRSNFHEEDGSHHSWPEILRTILYNSFLGPQNKFLKMYERHERLIISDKRYRVKTGLVKNYIELMGN